MRRSSIHGPVIGLLVLTVGVAAMPPRSAGSDPGFGVRSPTPVTLGDGPVIREHLRQPEIEAGRFSLDRLLLKGQELFVASFNTFDGAGRPEATGDGKPTPRARRSFPENFNRSSGPDANACAGCHNQPRAGGGGDNVANVFVLAQLHDFTHDISPDTGNERNTLGMWGAGAIEMLAREMTADLHAIRTAALVEAEQTGQPVTRPLITKGVAFGRITARPDGGTDDRQVEGVDRDLIVKPFHQKGVVVSLRQFTVNAMNHHHGMQASERFGDRIDQDGDGIADELTRGDITAVTLFQAAMEIPGQVIPRHPVIERAIRDGEATFTKIGCVSCHVPALTMDTPVYTEPNPYNPAGNLQAKEVSRAVRFDLMREGAQPRLERTQGGKAIVRAFTDLKRHKMGPRCNNEKLVQAGVPTDEFLTKKLWGFASEAPFMHNGRATTITEAILMHGDEAEGARKAFEALSQAERDEVIEFLKSLQVLPAGSRSLVVDETGRPR